MPWGQEMNGSTENIEKKVYNSRKLFLLYVALIKHHAHTDKHKYIDKYTSLRR